MLSRNGFQEIASASSSSVCQGNRLTLRRLSVLILAEVFWIGKLMDGHLEPYVVRDGTAVSGLSSLLAALPQRLATGSTMLDAASFER